MSCIDRRQGLLVNYAELPDKFITSVLPFHFQQPLREHSIRRMHDVSRMYSKVRWLLCV